jgi:hypothetical protein
MNNRGQDGHSAAIAAYLSVGGQRVQVAKMNGDYLTLAETCELAPKTEAQLNICIDGKKSTQIVLLDDGAPAGQRKVRYSMVSPF